MQSRVREALEGTALRVALVVWLFGYVLVALSAAVQGRAHFIDMLAASIPLGLLGITQSTLLGHFFERLHDRSNLMRWTLAGAAGMAAGVLQTAADLLWLRALALTVRPGWHWAFSLDAQRILIVFMLYGWSIFMVLGLVWAARSGDIARMNEARALAFEAAATRAEIAALRLQLNPHFLFNTLNGIASLVVRGKQEQAEEMIGRLADFLRSSLSANPAELIPLEQELATVRAYLRIEEARFGEHLRVSYHAEPEVRSLAVPNFLLQPLIENAIKHGGIGSRGTLQLNIAAHSLGEQAILTVENRRIGAPTVPAQPGTGLGLENTRHRLERHFGETAALVTSTVEGGFRVDITLPLRRVVEENAA